MISIHGSTFQKNILYDQYKYVAYIGVFKNKDYKYKSLILDTNIVINLEKFFYTPQQLKEIKRNAVVDLLIQNKHKNLITGYGEIEACWDIKKRDVNPEKYRKMYYAIENLLHWNKRQIINHAQSNGFNYCAANLNGISVPKGIDFSMNPPILFSLSSYLLILKLKLLNRKKSKGRELILFKEFVDFMISETGLVHAIELMMAHDYLLGSSTRSEYVQKILKFGSKDELRSTWNACWDLHFYRMLQTSFVSEWFYIERPKLATSDEGLITLCKYCSLIGHVTTEKSYVPIMFTDEKETKSEYEKEARAIINELNDTFQNRVIESKNYEERLDRIKASIQGLESSFTESQNTLI